MNAVQKFGQAIAVIALSTGPVVVALGWIGHVIQDPDSVAGTLAVNSGVALILAWFSVGVIVTVIALILFWVWVFGVAWDSEETRAKAADVD